MHYNTPLALPAALLAVSFLSFGCTTNVWIDSVQAAHLQDDSLIIAKGEPEHISLEVWVEDWSEATPISSYDDEAAEFRWDTDRPDLLSLSTDRGLSVTVTAMSDWFDLNDPSAGEPSALLTASYDGNLGSLSRTFDVRSTVSIAGVWLIEWEGSTVAIPLTQYREFIVNGVTDTPIGRIDGNIVRFRTDFGHFSGGLVTRTEMRGTIVDYQGLVSNSTATLQQY